MYPHWDSIVYGVIGCTQIVLPPSRSRRGTRNNPRTLLPLVRCVRVGSASAGARDSFAWSWAARFPNMLVLDGLGSFQKETKQCGTIVSGHMQSM